MHAQMGSLTENGSISACIRIIFTVRGIAFDRDEPASEKSAQTAVVGCGLQHSGAFSGPEGADQEKRK